MTKRQSAVGRPPETDGSGKQVAKTHITIMVPIFLREFLKANNVNMSQLFTRIATMLHLGEICPKCYNWEFIHKDYQGSCCTHCSSKDRYGKYQTFYFMWNNCAQCDRPYSFTNRGHPKMHEDGSLIQGCQHPECFGSVITPKQARDQS